MKIREVLKHIKELEPLTLLLMIEMNNFTGSEKMMIIEEYDILVRYLLDIIHMKEIKL